MDDLQEMQLDFIKLKILSGGVAVSTFELNTTLATTITATDTSIVLTDGSAEFPTTGYIVIESTNTDTSSLAYGRITSETIKYTGRNTGTNTLNWIVLEEPQLLLMERLRFQQQR